MLLFFKTETVRKGKNILTLIFLVLGFSAIGTSLAQKDLHIAKYLWLAFALMILAVSTNKRNGQ